MSISHLDLPQDCAVAETHDRTWDDDPDNGEVRHRALVVLPQQRAAERGRLVSELAPNL